MVAFHELALIMFGSLYGVLTTYVISRFGVITQELIDQRVWYHPAMIRTLPKEERARFFWNLHSFIAYPAVFFRHYGIIHRFCVAFADDPELQPRQKEWLQVVRGWEDKDTPHSCLQVNVYGVMLFGILLPPLMAAAYYYWLPSYYYWLPVYLRLFAFLPYRVGLSRSLFELVLLFWVCSMPLGGYVTAVARLESMVGRPSRYTYVSKWFWANLLLWIFGEVLAIVLEPFSQVLMLGLFGCFVATSVLLSRHFIMYRPELPSICIQTPADDAIVEGTVNLTLSFETLCGIHRVE